MATLTHSRASRMIANTRERGVEETPMPEETFSISPSENQITRTDAETAAAKQSTSKPSFISDCEGRVRSACHGEASYDDSEGGKWCVLHYPNKKKRGQFDRLRQWKIEHNDFDFCGAWFPTEANFEDFVFNANANFSKATFSEGGNFRYAEFKGADLREATFNGEAKFSAATFSEDAYFREVKFGADANFGKVKFGAGVDFSKARFNGDAYFRRAVFLARANFSRASFKESVSFFGETAERLEDGTRIPARSLGRDSTLDFQHATIEKPGRFTFHTVDLRPHWFVNVDAREFDLTDVRWNWGQLTIKGEIEALREAKKEKAKRENEELKARGQIEALRAEGADNFYSLLQKTCSQLAEHAEKNNLYEDASWFRYWAMDLARRDKWKGLVFWRTDWLHMLYGLVSGYGEKVRRAFLCLLGVWLVFALLYTRTGFETPLSLTEALWHSFNVMTLQKPEPKPLTSVAKVLVGLETVFGPVQAALVALAIRRKFMR
jgi:uncharacterized protein YjbI with pentapeptide repeats